MGYIQVRLGSGSYVSKHLPEASINVRHKGLSLHEENSKTVKEAALVPSNNKLFFCEYNHCEFDFQIERTDPSSFPTNAWRRIINRRLSAARSSMTHYVDPMGLLELRKAIASRLVLTRGMSVDAEQVLIVTGIQQGLNVIAHMFLQNAEGPVTVGIESPGFSGASTVFQNYGAELFPIPVDDEGVMIDALPQHKLDLAMISPSRHFPLCSTLPIERRKKLVEWANNTGSYLLEMDYDSEFRYEAPSLPALNFFDIEQRVIYLSSFTKSIGLGLRIGYMIVPPNLIALAKSCKVLLDYAMPWLDQTILAEFLNSGSFEQHIKGLRQRYLLKRDCLLASLESHFGVANVKGTESGTFLIWELPDELPEAENLKFLASKKQVGIYTLNHHTIYAATQHTNADRIALLGYAAMSAEDIDEAICRIAFVRTD